ncbi:hypothetical protein KAW65_06875 [candidate division WOR-3 bacterium]|nr:hypothetical protein [candidate division WOR-3 bacterium]
MKWKKRGFLLKKFQKQIERVNLGNLQKETEQIKRINKILSALVKIDVGKNSTKVVFPEHETIDDIPLHRPEIYMAPSGSLAVNIPLPGKKTQLVSIGEVPPDKPVEVEYTKVKKQ